MLVGPGEHPAVAGTVGGVSEVGTDSPGAGVEHRQVDGVAVWVASDDEVVLVCQHGHCGCPSIDG